MDFLLIDQTVKANAIRAVQNAPLGYEVIIRPARKSNRQERYFHSLVDLIAKQSGEHKERLKDLIKAPILGFEDKTDHMGRDYQIVRSSVPIDTGEYKLLIEAAKQMCGFLNIEIPAPKYYGYEERS